MYSIYAPTLAKPFREYWPADYHYLAKILYLGRAGGLALQLGTVAILRQPLTISFALRNNDLVESLFTPAS